MPNLAGIAVSVSATDGTVASSILVGNPFDFSPVPRLVFISLFGVLATLAVVVGAILVIIAVLMVVNKRKQEMEFKSKLGKSTRRSILSFHFRHTLNFMAYFGFKSAIKEERNQPT